MARAGARRRSVRAEACRRRSCGSRSCACWRSRSESRATLRSATINPSLFPSSSRSSSDTAFVSGSGVSSCWPSIARGGRRRLSRPTGAYTPAFGGGACDSSRGRRSKELQHAILVQDRRLAEPGGKDRDELIDRIAPTPSTRTKEAAPEPCTSTAVRWGCWGNASERKLHSNTRQNRGLGRQPRSRGARPTVSWQALFTAGGSSALPISRARAVLVAFSKSSATATHVAQALEHEGFMLRDLGQAAAAAKVFARAADLAHEGGDGPLETSCRDALCFALAHGPMHVRGGDPSAARPRSRSSNGAAASRSRAGGRSDCCTRSYGEPESGLGEFGARGDHLPRRGLMGPARAHIASSARGSTSWSTTGKARSASCGAPSSSTAPSRITECGSSSRDGLHASWSKRESWTRPRNSRSQRRGPATLDDFPEQVAWRQGLAPRPRTSGTVRTGPSGSPRRDRARRAIRLAEPPCRDARGSRRGRGIGRANRCSVLRACEAFGCIDGRAIARQKRAR